MPLPLPPPLLSLLPVSSLVSDLPDVDMLFDGLMRGLKFSLYILASDSANFMQFFMLPFSSLSIVYICREVNEEFLY